MIGSTNGTKENDYVLLESCTAFLLPLLVGGKYLIVCDIPVWITGEKFPSWNIQLEIGSSNISFFPENIAVVCTMLSTNGTKEILYFQRVVLFTSECWPTSLSTILLYGFSKSMYWLYLFYASSFNGWRKILIRRDWFTLLIDMAQIRFWAYLK